MTGWQPMDTAPRDGRAIIAFVPEGVHVDHKGHKHHFSVRVLPAYWVERPASESARKGKLVQWHGGYWSRTSCVGKPLAGGPTLWHPMPDAPVAA